MSATQLKFMLEDDNLKGLTAGEFAKTVNDGLEWLNPNWTPTSVKHYTNKDK